MSASNDGRPSQEPPRATPWLVRNIASSTMAATPIFSYPGRKAMPAVLVPSRNSAAVSLVPRLQRCWIQRKSTVPSGRETNARANTANESSVACSGSANGKNTFGNTSAEAMP